MFLVVKQDVVTWKGGSVGYAPAVVATATNLRVAFAQAARLAADENIVGVFEAEAAAGTATTARRVVRQLGGMGREEPQPVVWWGDEPHCA